MELEKRLLELQDIIYRKPLIEKKVTKINEEFIYLDEKRRELINQLDEQYINRNDIEKKSIIYLWYDLFTSKGKEVSRIEYDYKIYSDLYQLTYKELIELKNKLKTIDEYKEEYDSLLKEKELLIVESEKNQYEKVNDLSIESTKYKNRIRDINEAIYIGNKLNDALEYIIDLLGKAKKWGKVDIFSRGLFLSLTKTSIYKQADEKVRNLHYLMSKLQRQLEVINFYMDLDFDSRSIKELSNYYVNDLYNDMKDKKRLSNTLDYINNGYDIVNHISQKLTEQKEVYLKELIKIEQKKNQLMQK